jgi:hypothetical protein
MITPIHARRQSTTFSLGVDVGRFGADFTCFYVVEGARVLHAEARNGQDLNWTAGRTAALARQLGSGRRT